MLGEHDEQGYSGWLGPHYYILYKHEKGVVRFCSPEHLDNKIAVSIFLGPGQGVFGARVGMTFPEIQDILGTPDFGDGSNQPWPGLPGRDTRCYRWLQGSSKALKTVFGDQVLIQRCQVHKMRNVLDYLPNYKRPWVKRKLQQSWRSLKQVFFVRSLEQFICPCCHADKPYEVGLSFLGMKPHGYQCHHW